MAIIRRHLGPRMSFDSVITEFFRRFCATEPRTEAFIKQAHQELQRLEIYRFIRNVEDYQLINSHITASDVMAVTLLLINGEWLTLDTIISDKARFIREAIEKKDKLLDVVKRQLKEKTPALVPSKAISTGVEDAVIGTPVLPKSEYDIEFMRAQVKKSKPNSKSKSKKTSKK